MVLGGKVKSFFSKRKLHLKQLEIEQAKNLREQYQRTSTSHSLLGDLIRLIRWKVFSGMLAGGALYYLYQIFDTIELTYHGSQLTILPLKQKYESRLANSCISFLCLDEEILEDKSLSELVKPHKLLLLNRPYPIFQLLPNDYIVASKSFLNQLTESDFNRLVGLCQHHIQHRTNCHNLDLSYILSLTNFKLLGFPTSINQLTLQGSIIAKDYFFLSVNEEQEVKDEHLRRVLDNYRNQTQGKYSFLEQHLYI